MILIIQKDSNARLCKDGGFRHFALFGSYPECVKRYKCLGHAFHRAKSLSARVVNIPDTDNFTAEAGGIIIEAVPCPDKEGYVNYVQHDIEKFVVNTP